jgi:carbamoyltransferase
MIDLKPDGSFHLDLSYFDFCAGFRMTSRRFESLFGGPPRRPEATLTQREFDLAASIQRVTETIVLRMARHLHTLTGQRNLCLAGGVALNCVANGRLLRESPFERIWIQPAAGDAGGALGAALFVWHQLLGNPRSVRPEDSQRGSLLGPAFTSDAIEAVLSAKGAAFRRAANEAELTELTAELLATGNVVGWVQGRMEFGPRALGNRSILGDARDPEMQTKMNLKIKFRESFRPFAPVVLRERAAEFFDLEPDHESPYMLLVAPVRDAHRKEPAGPARTGTDRVRDVRSTIPAVTHVDYSARIQTVASGVNERLRAVLAAFERRTGCPMLVNTSFNIRGEPIVCTPEDAYRCFMATDMDALVIGDFVLEKHLQTPAAPEAIDELLTRYGAD